MPSVAGYFVLRLFGFSASVLSFSAVSSDCTLVLLSCASAAVSRSVVTHRDEMRVQLAVIMSHVYIHTVVIKGTPFLCYLRYLSMYVAPFRLSGRIYFYHNVAKTALPTELRS